jgi:WD40 repeat protein
VWGEQGEKPLWSRHSDQGNQYGFTYTPDGRSLAIFGRSPGDGKDAWVQVLDAATGKPGRLFVAPGQGRESASSIAFSPDGHLLAVSSGRNAMGMNVLVWDVATGEERFQLKSGQDSTVGVAFHPDGKILASIGLDGNVCLWNLAAPAGQSRLVQTIRVGLPSHNMWQVAFAPDGRHLLVLTGNGTINVLRLALPATKGNR